MVIYQELTSGAGSQKERKRLDDEHRKKQAEMLKKTRSSASFLHAHQQGALRRHTSFHAGSRAEHAAGDRQQHFYPDGGIGSAQRRGSIGSAEAASERLRRHASQGSLSRSSSAGGGGSWPEEEVV